jgi:hypothetical protein
MTRPRLLLVSVLCFAAAGLIACAAWGQGLSGEIQGLYPGLSGTVWPTTQDLVLRPYKMVGQEQPVGCPPYYPCDTKTYAIPQFADGTDPICYGYLGTTTCPAVAGVMPDALPMNERNNLVLSAWNLMRRKFATGELKDNRTSETVPIRWDDAPTVSACWSQFHVSHPACGPSAPTCTGKASWVTAEPYKPATWRIAIATNLPREEQRQLIVDGTINLVLMLTGNSALYNTSTGLDVRQAVLGY